MPRIFLVVQQTITHSERVPFLVGSEHCPLFHNDNSITLCANTISLCDISITLHDNSITLCDNSITLHNGITSCDNSIALYDSSIM